MNDIVKCLRRPVTYPDSASARIDRRAADYIETLQRERDEARAEMAKILFNIDSVIEHPDYTNPEGMVRRLRKALKGEGE